MKSGRAATYLHGVVFLVFALIFSAGHPTGAQTALNDSYIRADTLLKQKQYREALSLFEDILKQDPLVVEGYRSVMECYRALGDPQGAAVFIESLYLEDPHNAGANYGMGYALFDQKSYEAAGRYFDTAIELKPELAEAWNNRAVIFQFIEKNNDKAAQYYEEAIRLAKKSGNQRVVEIAQKNLAHIPQKIALRPVTETLSLEIFLNRLVDAVDKKEKIPMKELILGQRQNSEKAAEWLIDQAIQASSQGAGEEEKKAVRLTQVLAEIYSELFNSDLLIHKLKDYADLSDGHKQLLVEGETLLQEGVRFEETQQYSKAIASYRQSLLCFQKIHDDHRTGIASVYLGDAYLKSKDYAAACETYQNSHAYLQESVDAQTTAHVLASTGSACFHAGEYERAMDFLNRAKTLYLRINDKDAIKKIEQNIQLVKTNME